MRLSRRAEEPSVAENKGRALIRAGTDTRPVRPTYQDELEALAATYTAVRTWDAHRLRAAIERLAGGPVAFAGSGGMLAVSSLAAHLHEASTHEPGSSLTPLALMSRPAMASTGAVLFTSGGKHADTVELMRRLGRPGLCPAVVLTHREPAEMSACNADVVKLPALPVREGFLAVNSVLSMAVAMVRAYMGDVLPSTMAEVGTTEWPSDVDRILVLYPPQLAPIATDLETRISEIGLAAVQLADYRNFAHGRHTGLDRTLDRTTIVALSDADSTDLADATIGTLPTRARVLRWSSHSSWPLSALELLVLSMREAGHLGARSGMSMARPAVPVFGRKLYRLPIRRRIPERLLGSVDRKLNAAGVGLSNAEARESYAMALSDWVEGIATTAFGGVVLDYDGTVCTTEGRFDPPEPPVAAALNTALDAGLMLGFASGRGRSIHDDLRKVIDEAHWDRVWVGLYNGGYLVSLANELEDLSVPEQLIRDAHERIVALPFSSALELTARREQLTVEPVAGAWVRAATLSEVVREALARGPGLPVKVLRSGHSLDIVPVTASKVSILDHVSSMTGRETLAVGDQGQIGGNDFELLAHRRWSVSVDRCSADASRCWFVGDGSVSGPPLLLRYLKALVKRRDGHSLKVGMLL